jgi:hypothetical protein
MEGLSRYTEKDPAELVAIWEDLKSQRGCFGLDQPEMISGLEKEISRVTYVFLTKKETLDEKQVAAKARLELELAEEILKLKKSTKVKSYQGGQFVKIMFDALENIDWLKKNRNKTAVYLVMRRFICRAPMKDDKFDIYNRYYKANKLACCLSEEHLAHLFGYKTRSQIQRFLKSLEKDGAFVVETIQQRKPLKPKKVYILGEFQAGEEVYYYK